MKNEKLPLFEDFDNCRDHAERADWLLRVPLSILLTYEFAIRNRCHNRHFPEGASYCDLVLSAVRSVRDEHGGLGPAAAEMMGHAAALMLGVIAGEAR